MSLGREFKACFISSLLLISLFSVFVFAPASVGAEESTGTTTIYFHDCLMTDFIINQTAPTKDNDSQWPPSILNTEEWLEWFLMWLLYKDLLSEFNESELEELGFSPFVIVEYFDYYGEEDLEIKGDVVFNLFFSSTLFSKILKDEVKVGLSLDGIWMYNKTATIKSSLTSGKIQTTEITVEDVDLTISSGDSLMFMVELIPSEKPIGTIIEMQDEEELLNITEQIADLLTNQSYIPQLSEFGQENVKRYYLRDGNTMDDGEKPTNEKPMEADLKSAITWSGPDLERSKMLQSATASLYIDHQDLFRLSNFMKGKIKVTASLMYEDEEISSHTEEFDRTTLLDLFLKTDEPTTFTFTDIDQEIEYGKHISLKVGVSNGTTFGYLGFRRNVKLLYDASDFPSSLTVTFGETDHIKMDIDPSDDVVKVALGGSVEYTLNITSDFKEDIKIDKYGFSTGESKKWDIDIVPTSLSLDAGGQGNATIVVTSTDDDLAAYENGDAIEVIFTAAGKTGKVTFPANIEISEDAIEYDINIVAPGDKGIKYGTSKMYQFEIRNNNTGLWPDSYTIEASSEHDWDLNVTYNESKLEGLDPYVIDDDSVVVNVTVHVPKDVDVSSDKLTFKVISEASDKVVMVNVTTTVIGPNILEALYDFFESAAEGIGLADAFGSPSLGAIFLASIVFIIIFFIIIIIVYFLTIKYVNLVCLERIKEVSPDEEATFEITVQNPYKYPLTYEVSAKETSSSEGWDVSLDTENIALESKQSKTVIVVVRPTSFVKPDDWAEVTVTVKAVEKQKSAEIVTVTTIKDGTTELTISGVFHWPRVFRMGDRVTTSFKLYNKGNTSASNISVILYVNGKEKNKVEDITIPRDGYADIEIPWIAGKGKNEVNIVVK